MNASYGTRNPRGGGPSWIYFRLIPILLVGTLASASLPASADSVHASYFAFADTGSFIDGGADSSSTRIRAVVDSGFVHTPLFIGGHSTDWTWQGKASAHLGTGALRTYAFSDTTDSHADTEAPLPDHGWRAQSTAALTDVVTFAAPAGVPAGPAAVTFRLDVRGNFAGSFAAMSSSTMLMVNGVKSQVEFEWGGRLGPGGSPDAAVTTTGTVTGLSTDARQLHALLSVTALVTPGNPVALTANASTKAAAGPFASVTSDFDHTATLSIEAPPGFVFTSRSGLLLTTPVPEPGTWWSLAAGLAVLAGTRSWRRPGRFRAARQDLPAARQRRFGAAQGSPSTRHHLQRVWVLGIGIAIRLAGKAPRIRRLSLHQNAVALGCAALWLAPLPAMAESGVTLLPLAFGTFSCAGKTKEQELIVIERNAVSFVDGGTASCFGVASAVNRNPFVKVSASATGGSVFPMTIQINVSVEHWYRAQEYRKPPFVPNILPEKFPLIGKVETGMPFPDSQTAFISAFANVDDGQPQVQIANLRGNGILRKTAKFGAGHLDPIHVEYRAQCRVVASKGQTVKCDAELDPLPEFDQEAFDLTNALAGRQTYRLDDYYRLEFSPNMVPEPATWFGLVAGLPLLALAVRPSKTKRQPITKKEERLTSRLCGMFVLLPLLGFPFEHADAGERLVIVNGQALPGEQIQALEAAYRVPLSEGRYWYDRNTGWWGREGGPALGVVSPGLPVGGVLAQDASRGSSRVFINGRELHRFEVAYLSTLGTVIPGRYWADANGNIGVVGAAWPFANLYALAAQRYGDRGPYRTGGGAFGSDGNCMYYHGKDAAGHAIGASTGC